MEWVTEGFEGFSMGIMGNGGQNLYVSRRGVLQRIFHRKLAIKKPIRIPQGIRIFCLRAVRA